MFEKERTVKNLRKEVEGILNSDQIDWSMANFEEPKYIVDQLLTLISEVVGEMRKEEKQEWEERFESTWNRHIRETINSSYCLEHKENCFEWINKLKGT